MSKFRVYKFQIKSFSDEELNSIYNNKYEYLLVCKKQDNELYPFDLNQLDNANEFFQIDFFLTQPMALLFYRHYFCQKLCCRNQIKTCLIL